MKNLVEVITKALVDNPEGVVVTEKQEGKTTVIEVHVADKQSDLILLFHNICCQRTFCKNLIFKSN